MKVPSFQREPLAALATLARLSGTRAVFPRPDGSLLFVADETPHPARALWPRPTVSLAPEDMNETHLRLEGFSPEQAGIFVVRLRKALKLDAFAPLLRAPDPNRPIEPLRWLVKAHLAAFLEEGRTQWGAFRFEPTQNEENGVLLSFASDTEGLTLRVRHHTAEAEIGARRSGPLLVSRVEDTRRDRANPSFHRSPELYLEFVLNRVLHPDQTLRRPGADDPALPIPETPNIWTKPDTLFDSRTEVGDTGFFIPRRKLGTFETLSTLFGMGEGLSMVIYGHAACLRPSLLDLPESAGVTSHRFANPRFRPPATPIRVIQARNLDLVLGGEQAFRQAVRQAADDPRTKLLAVFCTCIVEFIGLDYKAILAEETAGRDLPTLTWISSPGANTPMSEFWGPLFARAKRNPEPMPDWVNLVGFGARESAAGKNLVQSLETLGIRVGAEIGPGLRLKEIETFFAAGCTLIADDEVTAMEFSGVIPEQPGHRIVTVSPPFGPTGTRRFLLSAARAAGIKPGLDEIEALWEPWREEWERLRERARRHEIALIVDAQSVEALIAPARLYGIPLVDLLLEMGFSLRLVGVPLENADGREALDKLEQGLSRPLREEERIALQTVDDPKALPETLRELPSALVFTEFPPDRRLLRAGKHGVSPRTFEPGFLGAVTSLRRLVRLAESAFHRAFEEALS